MTENHDDNHYNYDDHDKHLQAPPPAHLPSHTPTHTHTKYKTKKQNFYKTSPMIFAASRYVARRRSHF